MQQTNPDFEAAFSAAFPVDNAFEAAFSTSPAQSYQTQTPTSQHTASRIEDWINAHGYWIRERHPIGYHNYPQGLWSISRAMGHPDGYVIEGDFLRYADAIQLREMETILGAGMLEELDDLIHAVGVKEGPVRAEGKPPIDPKGNPLVVNNNGNHGSLPAECKWIEERDPVYIQYLGKDENWPQGCWAIESADVETQYFNADGIKHIAHEVLGMPAKTVRKKTQLSLAKVGLNALIDEATGYEDERPQDELRNMFAEYQSEQEVDPFESAFSEQPAQQQTQTVSFDDAFRDPRIPF